MALGVMIVGVGIAFAKYSTTGTSPISCIPAVLSNYAASLGYEHLTLGVLLFCMNMILVLAEILILRSRFKPIQLLQLPAVFVMSWATDFSMGFIVAIPLPDYFSQLACVVLSVIIMSLGIFFEVKANVFMLPGEAIVTVISSVLKKPFARCKVIFDTSLTLGGVLISLVLLGGLYGVREGTIISAVFAGVVVKFWATVFSWVDSFLPPAPVDVVPPIISSEETYL